MLMILYGKGFGVVVFYTELTFIFFRDVVMFYSLRDAFYDVV